MSRKRAVDDLTAEIIHRRAKVHGEDRWALANEYNVGRSTIERIANRVGAYRKLPGRNHISNALERKIFNEAASTRQFVTVGENNGVNWITVDRIYWSLRRRREVNEKHLRQMLDDGARIIVKSTDETILRLPSWRP